MKDYWENAITLIFMQSLAINAVNETCVLHHLKKCLTPQDKINV